MPGICEYEELERAADRAILAAAYDLVLGGDEADAADSAKEAFMSYLGGWGGEWAEKAWDAVKAGVVAWAKKYIEVAREFVERELKDDLVKVAVIGLLDGALGEGELREHVLYRLVEELRGGGEALELPANDIADKLYHMCRGSQ